MDAYALIDYLLKFCRFLGINRAVSYGVLSRAWGVFAGPVTMFVVAARFSMAEQGFYYTISSLLALQIFFELGLMTVIAQFASHEFVHLRWKIKGEIEGDPIALSRFIDLLYKAAKWFGVASLLLIIGLIPVGLVFFGQNQHGSQSFAWRLPWILAVVGTALNLLVTPFFAVLMGSGDVTTVNHRQMIGNVIGSFTSWLVISLNGGLYAVCAVNFGSALISWTYLVRYKPGLFRLVWRRMMTQRQDDGATLSWWGEVWPMQWKIALSWVSGYFMFQLFNPVLFQFHGPGVAGQMGMTLSAANALLGVCITWMNVRAPEFGKLVSRRDWLNLDRLFSHTMIQTVIVALTGAFVGWATVWFLQKNFAFGQRFLPATQTAFLFSAIVVQIVICGFATYLRAHKQEPLLLVSLAAAIIQGSLTWLLGKYFAGIGVTSGFFVSSLLFSMPAVYFVWVRSKKAWH